jgi:hypothetical protein
MKAALALIFFACFAGSMAAPNQLVEGLLAQGQGIVQAVVGQLHQQITSLVQQAIGHVTGLLAGIGGRLNFNLNDILGNFKPMLDQLTTALLGQISGSLAGIFGGT